MKVKLYEGEGSPPEAGSMAPVLLLGGSIIFYICITCMYMLTDCYLAEPMMYIFSKFKLIYDFINKQFLLLCWPV